MRRGLRFASVIGAVTLGAVAVAPAVAAAPISQAGANAVTVALAGNEQGTGNVTATNDGSGEKKTGDTAPPIGVLGGAQTLIRSGVLAQEATARAGNGAGDSAACAGAAGAGGSVVRIGDTECLKAGNGTANLNIASLDLSDTFLINPDSALGAVDTAALSTALGQVTNALAKGVSDASADLANLGLHVNLDAISAHCTAEPGTADGDSDFTDTDVTLNVPGQDPVVLQSLKAHYPANTDVFVNIDEAVDVILAAVEEDLRSSLNGAFVPLDEAVAAPLRDAIVNQALSQVKGQLKPLSDNVLRITLNKQTRSPGAIRVNAIDMQILPAAKEQLGASAAAVQIGNVVCGPSTRVAVAAPAAAAAPQSLPKGVSAGLASAPGLHAPTDNSHTGVTLAAFAIMLTAGTALVVVRRLRA